MLFALLAVSVSAQSAYQLRGRVVDKNGQPLIGATVVCKNNPQQGAVAGADGYFTLQVTANETLVVSMLSYETREVPVQGRRALVAELSDGNEQIEEIVVIGYGEQNAKDVTGAITSVNMAAIDKKFARSTMCGSFAAFSIIVRPFALTAANIRLIVAPTDTTLLILKYELLV